MRIDRVSPLQGPSAQGPAAAAHASDRPAEPPRDSFNFTTKDLTPQGKVPIIIFAPKPHDLARVRRALGKSDHGSRVSQDLSVVNGFSALVDPQDLSRIMKAIPKNVHVHLNKLISYPEPFAMSALEKDVPTAPPLSASTLAEPGIDPSRETTGIEKVWDRGFTGKGVGIAIIDSGIYPHPDLKDRIKGWVDVADGKPQPYDKFGHGTHVAGDAAGSGQVSGGKFKGIAPDADLIGVRITTVAEAIKGIQWCIENKEKYNIKVINMSLGDFAAKPYKDDPWAQASEKAIAAGMVVVVAAGNEGPDSGTISTPATDPRVITVGALDDKHTSAHQDDTMAPFSSRGPTSVDGLSKPDIIAPGVGIYSTLAPSATLDVPELPHVGKDYIAISGTSMATPIVSGLVATLLQANPNLTHDDVKKILMATADPYLKDDRNAQGAGAINAEKALDQALAMAAGAPAPTVNPPPAPPASGPTPESTSTTPAPRSLPAPTQAPPATTAGQARGGVPVTLVTLTDA